MDIFLYNTSSPANVVNKKNIKRSNGRRVNKVTFKDNNSMNVENPTLVLELSDDASELSCYNYVEIPAFSRYYFIDSISTKGALCEINCTSDPLTSFKNDILNSTQIIARCSNENIANKYLTDNEMPIEVRNDLHVKNFGGDVADTNCIHVILETAGKGGNI